ncbi:hypothetical protein [Jiella avicenniae]|uniref:Uncharacterized protein n=1 Tax=Jiella avicenniae TaxID=2907202 RepID=A0A9X1NZ20_9HYPH|nr:hypothetical protein [Jiella avicenniae]MCE7027001.1 hypothetical protein [Jiella avicenniae]
MSIRLTATVRQKRLRKSFRQLVEEGLGRTKAGNPLRQTEALPRTSNLARTSAGRALLADPFSANADLDGENSRESER